MVNVSDGRRIKSPPAFARVLLLAALTVPPCGHIITLEVLSSWPILILVISSALSELSINLAITHFQNLNVALLLVEGFSFQQSKKRLRVNLFPS